LVVWRGLEALGMAWGRTKKDEMAKSWGHIFVISDEMFKKSSI
jgi:hypothetical protein